MTSAEAVAAAIDALNRVGMAHMLVGSFSSNRYGVVRATRDVDFVVDPAGRSMFVVADAMGPTFRLDPQIGFETVTGTTRHLIHCVEIPFKIEMFALSDEPFDRERFARRNPASVGGRPTFVQSVEDVLVAKLRWFVRANRRKDEDDIRDVIAVSGEHVDWEYVHRWCGLHGTRDALDSIRASVPPL